jgi:hypothetical protein
VAHSLRQYLSAQDAHPLHRLVDLLPYLPALLKIAPQCRALPADASWARWTESVLGIVAGTQSPALAQLSRQLHWQLEECLSDGLMSGVAAFSEAGSKALGVATTMARNGLGAMASVPDPLSLKGIVVDAAPTPRLPRQAQMQELHAVLVEQGMDDAAAESATRARFAENTEPADVAMSEAERRALLDEFDPFAERVKTVSYRETIDASAVAAAWLATAYLAYLTLSQRRAEAPPAGTLARYATPLAFASMSAVSIGASVVFAKAHADEDEEAFDSVGADATGRLESTTSAGEAANTDLARSQRARRTTWEESMRALFDFSGYAAVTQQRLLLQLSEAIETTAASNVASDARTAHMLVNLDSRFAPFVRPIEPAAHPLMRAQFLAFAIERTKLRTIMAEQLRDTPTVSRTGMPSLPPIDENTFNWFTAYEIQPIDQGIYAEQLLHHYAAANAPVEIDEPDIARRSCRQGQFLDLVPCPPLPPRAPWPAHTTTTSHPAGTSNARIRRLYETGIELIDQRMCDWMIRRIEQSSRSVEELQMDLIAFHRTIRTNIGDAILTLMQPTALSPASAAAYTNEEKILLQQVAKFHATSLFDHMWDFLEVIVKATPASFSKRLSSAMALAEAKSQAARITLMKFARVEGGPRNSGMTLDDREAHRLFTLLRGEGPEISAFLNEAASLLYAILTGNIPPRVKALGKRRDGATDGDAVPPTDSSELTINQDRYFSWLPAMMKKFNEAELNNRPLLRLTEPDPPGFRSIASFKRSNEFATWQQYFDQFDTYSDHHLDRESKQYSVAALVDAGLDEFEMTRPVRGALVLELACSTGDPNNEEHLHRFLRPPGPLRPTPGLVGVICLANEDVLVLTSIDGQAIGKVFSSAEVKNNATLTHLVENRPIKRRHGTLAYLGGYSANELRGDVLIDNLIKPLWGSVARSPINGRGDFPALIKRWDDPYALDVTGKCLLEMADETMKQSLAKVAAAVKAANVDDTVWHSGASMLIPFYSMGFNGLYDRDFTPSKTEIITNFIAVASALVPMGIGLTRLGHASWKAVSAQVMHNMALGKTGPALVRATIQGLAALPNLPALGLQAVKILGVVVY